MNTATEIIKTINSSNLTKDELVSILILVASNLDIDTISETARKEGKTRRGIEISNRYRKIKIGKQTLAVKDLRESKLPF